MIIDDELKKNLYVCINIMYWSLCRVVVIYKISIPTIKMKSCVRVPEASDDDRL